MKTSASHAVATTACGNQQQMNKKNFKKMSMINKLIILQHEQMMKGGVKV